MDASQSPPSPPDREEEIVYLQPARQESALKAYWQKMGGGSLTLSLLAHAVLLVAALLLAWNQLTLVPEEVDFLSGGGGGTAGNTRIAEEEETDDGAAHPQYAHLRLRSRREHHPAGHKLLRDGSLPGGADRGAHGRMPGTGGGFGGGSGSGTGIGSGIGMGPGKAPGFTAKFLGLDTTGNNIIFCIDTSGSMGVNLKPEGIAAVRRELSKAIDSLPSTAYFNLICFGQNGDIFKPKSVAASIEAKKEAGEFMKGYFGGSDFGRTRTERYGKEGKDKDGISYVPLMPDDVKELAGTGGGSRIDLAMVAAFERDASTIFVLSDGAPTTVKSGETTPMDKGALIDLIHEKYKVLLKDKPITVSTISVEAAGPEGVEGVEFLRQLARKFGGKHKEVKPAKL